MATAPIIDFAADEGFDIETDVDISDHLEAQTVAHGIEDVLKDLGLHGFESAISADYDKVTVQFSSPQDPTVAQSVIRLFDGPTLVCLGQSHSATDSRFEFGPAPEAPLPSRAHDAADALKDSGFVPTFRILPAAASRGCACSGDWDNRPTEEPVGFAAFVIDEDGDPIYSSTFHTRELAMAGIAAQMRTEGVPDWGVYDEEGVLELFGPAADAILDGEDGNGLLAEPSETEADRLDRLADLHEFEREQESLVEDPGAVAELREIEQDAFFRTLRKAA